MDRTVFITSAFKGWTPPDTDIIDAFIAQAEADTGLTVAAITVTDPLYGALINRVKYETVFSLCMETAEKHSYGPIGAASDMFKHYETLLGRLEAQFEARYKSKIAARLAGLSGNVFQVIPTGFKYGPYGNNA